MQVGSKTAATRSERETNTPLRSENFVCAHLTLTDKNAVFRLALYPPLRPSAVRIRTIHACVRSSVCIVCVLRVYLYACDVSY